jgi:hypothetical protein
MSTYTQAANVVEQREDSSPSFGPFKIKLNFGVFFQYQRKVFLGGMNTVLSTLI